MILQRGPDLGSCCAVHHQGLKRICDRAKEPCLDDLISLKPELMVWIRNRCSRAVNGRRHDSSNWLRGGTRNELKQALPTKKRLELTFPEKEILLIELNCDTVDDV